MSDNPNHLTRRHFSHLLAASTAASLFARSATASSTPEPNGFAYVASKVQGGTIHAFQVSGSHWRKIQSIQSISPAHLEPHPTLPILYAVHDVPLWNHLPRGAVSAYAIDPKGRLTHRNTQPLSLSATNPRHAAVTPGGQSLLVASEGAGIYNLLPIAANGTLQPPTAIRKELSLASPRHLLVHPSGAIFTADPGQQAITTFTLMQDFIQLRHRLPTQPGTGPSHLALHPCASHLYALDATSGSIAVHALKDVHPAPRSQTFKPSHPGPSLIAMHPGGRFLLLTTADTLSLLAINREGHLAPRQIFKQPEPAHTLSFVNGGSHLVVSQAFSRRILLFPFDAESGILGSPQLVAHLEDPTDLQFRSA